MKSFKNYAPDNKPLPPTQEGATAEELTKRIVSAYNGKSNADMMQKILAEAEKGKRAGTLSNEEIDNFYQSFAPMLDGVQRKRLKVIVEKLKRI